MTLSKRVQDAVKAFCRPYIDLANEACEQLEALTSEYPIVLIAVYGSILSGLRRGSDVDILVLYDSDKTKGTRLYFEMQGRIQDIIDSFYPRGIPVDIQLLAAEGFLSPENTSSYKRGVAENHLIMWMEEGYFESRGYI